MSEPYIIFKGVDSRTLGVVMEKLPEFFRPLRNVELIQVAGRSGRLEQDDGTHDVFTTSMKVNCFGIPMRDVYAWLGGAGWLISSEEPNRAVWASIHMPINPTRFSVEGKCYHSLTCTVYCQPYRYFMPEVDDVTITQSLSDIYNPGTWDSEPEITIRASGNVSVILGQYQMDFEGLSDGIIVDCEAQECYSLDKAVLMNSFADIEEFPKLKPGMNAVQWTGSVSSITVRRRCRDI